MVLGDGVAVYSRPDGNGGRRTLAGGELLHHEGLADTLDDYLNFGPEALTTGRGAGISSPPCAPTAARCPSDDMAQYQVQELPVRAGPLRPGRHLRARTTIWIASAGTAAGAERARCTAPAPAERARSLVRALRAPAVRAETTTVVAVDEQGNACAATHSLGLGSGHLDRRGARQLDARRG